MQPAFALPVLNNMEVARTRGFTSLVARGVSWLLAALLTLVIAPYTLLVVAPFVRHGLFFRYVDVAAGIYDPKGLAPYDWFSLDFRYTLTNLALYLHTLVACVLPVLAVTLLILLLLRPSAFSRRETIAFYSIAMSALLLFCAAYSLFLQAPTWLMD
ncbi:MAG: hypothetical protein M3441_01935 [Chloroflexota bacterium]|nr:hypothetical protein [Chloroflexota bacterium]